MKWFLAIAAVALFFCVASDAEGGHRAQFQQQNQCVQQQNQCVQQFQGVYGQQQLLLNQGHYVRQQFVAPQSFGFFRQQQRFVGPQRFRQQNFRRSGIQLRLNF